MRNTSFQHNNFCATTIGTGIIDADTPVVDFVLSLMLTLLAMRQNQLRNKIGDKTNRQRDTRIEFK